MILYLSRYEIELISDLLELVLGEEFEGYWNNKQLRGLQKLEEKIADE